jgi:hypothetical protein
MSRTIASLSLAIAFGATGGSFPAHADSVGPGTCDGFGAVTFSPAHPILTDVIGVRVKSWKEIPAVEPSPAETTLSRAQLLPYNLIYVNVIVTPYPEKYSGYRVAVPYDDSYGLIGPLAVGDYAVTSSVVHEDASGKVTRPCPDQAATILGIGTDRTATTKVPVVEFYNAALDHYFITQEPAEISDLDTGVHPGWLRTGESFLGYAPGKSDNRARPACRFYGKPTLGRDTHFYSVSTAECVRLARAPNTDIWSLESADVFELGLPDRATGVCPIGSAPLYRLWNGRTDSNHRYTASASTREAMIAKNWVSEGYGPDGASMCAPLQ